MAITNIQDFQDHDLLKNSPGLQRVLRVFDAMTSHPRASKEESAIRAELINIAEEQGWTVRVDQVGNVAFDVPATPGRESAPHIVLQGHMDQVTTPEDKHLSRTAEIVVGDSGNSEQPGTDLWIQTVGRNMTLGADNGIGVSSAMGALMDPELPHGKVTILITVDEETGMTGAKNLSPWLLPASGLLINLDSEEGPEGICIGCAGGVDIVGRFPIETRSKIPSSYSVLDVQLMGFVGGHSGVEIHKGRGNALVSMMNFLSELRTRIGDVKLISFDGGTARNAIPSSARATIAIDSQHVGVTNVLYWHFINDIRQGVDVSTPEMTGSLIPENASNIRGTLTTHVPLDPSVTAISRGLRDKLFSLFAELPQGPLKSAELPNVGPLVTLSNNVGVAATKEDFIEVVSMARAANIDELKVKMQEIEEMFTSREAALMKRDEPSSGWLEDPNRSPAVSLAISAVEKVVGKYILGAYHAGLEAGIVSGKSRDMSAVAICPLILEAHTPRERVNLHSVDHVLRVIQEMLSSAGMDVDSKPVPVEDGAVIEPVGTSENRESNSVPGITMLVTGELASRFEMKRVLLGEEYVRMERIGSREPSIWRITLPRGTYAAGINGIQIMAGSPEECSGPEESEAKFYLGAEYSSVVNINAYNSGERWQNRDYDDIGLPIGS